MVNITRLSSSFANLIKGAGRQIKVEWYDPIYDGVYDENDGDQGLSLSGTLWTSGIVLPLNGRDGSEDSILSQQGKLQNNDQKLYVNGSLTFAGVDKIVKIQLGSPTGEIYSTIPDGGKVAEISAVPIYKRQYIRLLGAGGF